MITNTISQSNTSVSNFSNQNLYIDADGCPVEQKPQHVVKTYERLNHAEFTQLKHRHKLEIDQWCKDWWLSNNQEKVLKALANHSDAKGRSTIAHKTLADVCRLSVTTVKDALKSFEVLKVIRNEGKSGWGKTNTYLILFDEHKLHHKETDSDYNITNNSCIFFEDTSDSKSATLETPEPDAFTQVKEEKTLEVQLIKTEMYGLGISLDDVYSLLNYATFMKIPNSVLRETINRIRAIKANPVLKNSIQNMGGYFRHTLKQRFEYFKIIQREQKEIEARRDQTPTFSNLISGMPDKYKNELAKLDMTKMLKGGSRQDEIKAENIPTSDELAMRLFRMQNKLNS